MLEGWKDDFSRGTKDSFITLNSPIIRLSVIGNVYGIGPKTLDLIWIDYARSRESKDILYNHSIVPKKLTTFNTIRITVNELKSSHILLSYMLSEQLEYWHVKRLPWDFFFCYIKYKVSFSSAIWCNHDIRRKAIFFLLNSLLTT